MSELSACGEPEIASIANDSRRVEAGTLFVAVPSAGGDADSGGHLHVDSAIKRGAAAVVIQGGPPPAEIPWIRVADSRGALADLAAKFYGHPSQQLQLYAVTGTDGKTTTTYLLEQIFTFFGYCTGLIGTIEIKIGEDLLPNPDRMTTPESLDIQRLLRRMADVGVTHAAIEASSHALALQRLRGCAFAAAALTNIASDHIEFHGSWEAYLGAKSSLFTRYAAGAPAVLNRDDPNFERIAALCTGSVLSYGFSQEAELRATDLQLGEHATTCRVAFGRDEVGVTVPLPGAFNVSNSLAAVGLALQSGVSLPLIAQGLARAKPPPGRLQRVSAEGRQEGFEVLVDYAHTAQAFRSVLGDLHRRAAHTGKIIAVFGAAGNRDRAKRPELASIARQYADYFYITNEDPCGEEAESIIEEVASGVGIDEEGTRFEREPDRRVAIERAVQRARPGDTVIILGKGHEQSIEANGDKQPWSDVAVARAALEAIR